MLRFSKLFDRLIQEGTIVCPKCHCRLVKVENNLICDSNYRHTIDTINSAIPVLVDFDKDTVLNRNTLLATSGDSLIPRTDTRNSLAKRILWGSGAKTKHNLKAFLNAIQPARNKKAVILVVGGGAIGRGTADLFSQEKCETLVFDIYASANTDFIADAHNIPLADQSIDAVWIQAVLEHVVSPNQVAFEIDRVLKVGGLIYAETPFLQNVHEGAYDFTRFTESGHRLLFQRFILLDSGYLNGLGTVLLWNIRYLFWGITRSRKLATVLIFPFFWLRFLEKIIPDGVNVDSASGVYFLGVKSPELQVRANNIIQHYKGYQQ